jgi:hypothetical protein
MINHRRTGTHAARHGLGVIVLPMHAFVPAVVLLVSFSLMRVAEYLEVRLGAG